MEQTDPPGEIQVTRCPTCGKQDPADHLRMCRVALVTCEDCRRRNAEKAWSRICPPYFLNTDRSKLPDQVHSHEALEWAFMPRGLCLIGPTRTGKSRTAWEVIKDQVFDGKTADNVDGRRLGLLMLGYGRDGGAAAILEKWCTVDILLMDDVFKVKLTERVEEQIFNIIDERMQMLKPIIMTTNDDQESLLSRLSADRGPALVERLKEICHAISFSIPGR